MKNMSRGVFVKTASGATLAGAASPCLAASGFLSPPIRPTAFWHMIGTRQALNVRRPGARPKSPRSTGSCFLRAKSNFTRPGRRIRSMTSRPERSPVFALRTVSCIRILLKMQPARRPASWLWTTPAACCSQQTTQAAVSPAFVLLPAG